jgi:flagellar P-ring protein precursor FlgI
MDLSLPPRRPDRPASIDPRPAEAAEPARLEAAARLAGGDGGDWADLGGRPPSARFGDRGPPRPAPRRFVRSDAPGQPVGPRALGRALWLVLAIVAIVALGVRSAGSASTGVARIKDLADFEGVRSNPLTGFGLVVGLAGTGDDNLDYAIQATRSAAQRLGVSLPPASRQGLKNSAAVMLIAELPAFARPGQRIDVTVSAIGKAKSLRGGTLLLAELKGPDGQVYALAQGSLAVGGLGVDARDGSRVTINVPSSGRIPDGATVERAAPAALDAAPVLTLALRRPDFTDAQAVAAAINARLGPGRARALDSVAVALDAPADPAGRAALIGRIEGIEIAPSPAAARVIVNARTGTIVIGGAVRVAPAVVAHGSLTVRIEEEPFVSQPAPFSQGRTVEASDSRIEVEQPPAQAFVFAPGAALSDVVDAINRVGASPSDLVAILEALKQAGALKAELVII